MNSVRKYTYGTIAVLWVFFFIAVMIAVADIVGTHQSFQWAYFWPAFIESVETGLIALGTIASCLAAAILVLAGFVFLLARGKFFD